MFAFRKKKDKHPKIGTLTLGVDVKECRKCNSKTIGDIIAILKDKANTEHSLELQAWCDNNTEGYHMHRYTAEKLDALITAISAMEGGTPDA